MEFKGIIMKMEKFTLVKIAIVHLEVFAMKVKLLLKQAIWSTFVNDRTIFLI